MKRLTFLFTLLFVITGPLSGFSEEPVSPDGFIEITEHILEKFNVLENRARNSNFNQFRNPVLQDKFDEIRTDLERYEKHTLINVNNWPEGQQKTIASELHATNFHYRAYSMSQHNSFRQEAEKSLQKVRQKLREYIERL